MQIDTTIYYNQGVSTRQFFVGEMVWRMNEIAHQVRINKLCLKWERPYKLVIILHPNAAHLLMLKQCP